MIPSAFLQAWSAAAPWPDLRQIEQDLIICRALCDLFTAPALKGKIAFRGGTAINKLLFKRPLRYSEDIDLVQIQAETIGPIVNAIRDALAWLGPCKRDQAGHSMHLVFKFAPEADPTTSLKVKVENTIAVLLPHGQARHDVVAAKLGMSPRTLSRRFSCWAAMARSWSPSNRNGHATGAS